LKEDYNEHINKRFKRNYKLINLTAQPKELKAKIIEGYEKPLTVGKVKLYEFMLKNSFNGLADNLTLFKNALKVIKI